MSLTPRLDLRQTQSLTMTPQLRQAIRLLQMSAQELDAFVSQETEQNPFLQRDGDETSFGNDADTEAHADDFSETLDRDALPTLCDAGEDEAAPEITADPAEDSFYEQSDGNEGPSFGERDFAADAWRGQSDGGDDDGFRYVDVCPDTKQSLTDFVMRQARVAFTDEKRANTAFLLIEALDVNGFLPADLSAVREKSGADETVFDGVLATMKTFEPTGVFSQSLTEFFERQLAEKDRCDPAMKTMLAHLDLVAAKKYDELSKLCGVDLSDIADMVAEIRRLSPRPSTAFDADPVSVVIPDVLVRADKAGAYHVELNRDALPRVLINRHYAAEIEALAGHDKATKKFYTEKMGAASFLMKALNQRAETVLKVATFIVETQRDFFERGISALKPMILKDAAAAIGMHESTVSRVTSNKYLACARGVFELKYFFSKALEGAGGSENKSALAVKDRIAALIKAETPQTVLSDEDLVILLRREGIEIARRTVAKYRESAGIPTSAQRKREKRLNI